MRSISGWVPPEIALRQATMRGRPERDPDEAYERERQRRDDMDENRILDDRMSMGVATPADDLGSSLFDQAAETARMQASYLQLGRQQKALEVILWIRSNASALKGAPVESLLALCNKELK